MSWNLGLLLGMYLLGLVCDISSGGSAGGGGR